MLFSVVAAPLTVPPTGWEGSLLSSTYLCSPNSTSGAYSASVWVLTGKRNHTANRTGEF